MGKIYRFAANLLMFAVLATVLNGCLQDECTATRTYLRYDPVYVNADEFRSGIASEVPRTIENPGKIYVYQNYLFINELNEGVHILDNEDPSHPQAIGFLAIPGNVDIAVRGRYLYADSYIDLVTFDLSDPASPVLAGRTEDVFPFYGQGPMGELLVAYEATEVSEEFPCIEDRPNIWVDDGSIWVLESAADAARPAGGRFNTANAGAAAATATGVGGSLARFTIGNGHLYTVEESGLKVFSLENPTSPELINTNYFGWGIETIFPLGDHLFIGSREGMYIFDASNPAEPVMLSVFQHANACDPVYVDGNTAYVTLRDGTECQNFTNQLEVVDVTDLRQPELLYTYPMHHPIGLSVNNQTLYLCDDDEGLKIFDASRPDGITDRQLSHLKGFQAWDIITLGDLAIVVGRDGLYQFDISDPENLKELSLINVTRN